MRWRGREGSDNIEDRRGMSVRRVGGIGGVGAIVVTLIALYLGKDPTALLEELEQTGASDTQRSEPYQESVPEAEARQLVAVVLRDTEQTWQRLFAAAGQRYVEPRLVLFTDAVRSACGTADAAVGPFYCSRDQQVYIDLSFYDELQNRFGAPGDFAQAYVIAHEVGHHVQNLLGTAAQVHAAAKRATEVQANALSVRMELQADCFAGIWAHHADASRQLLESGDIEEGLAAASAIGDDRLQKLASGYVSPESLRTVLRSNASAGSSADSKPARLPAAIRLRHDRKTICDLPESGLMQELVTSLVSQLGITPAQAQGGAGAIFKAAQERLGHGEFERLLGGLPGVNDLLGHVPSPATGGGGLGGMLGGLAAIAAKAGGSDMAQAVQLLSTFNSLGLNKEMAMKFLPVVLQFVESKGGKELVTQLRTALKL